MSDVLSEWVVFISVCIAIVSAIIAFLAEYRARKIERSIRLTYELKMYADIGYGNLSDYHPWTIYPTTLGYGDYEDWLKRFISYNGIVNIEIQEDFDILARSYIHYKKKRLVYSRVEYGDGYIYHKWLKIQEYAQKKVKEIGNELKDSNKLIVFYRKFKKKLDKFLLL